MLVRPKASIYSRYLSLMSLSEAIQAQRRPQADPVSQRRHWPCGPGILERAVSVLRTPSSPYLQQPSHVSQTSAHPIPKTSAPVTREARRTPFTSRNAQTPWHVRPAAENNSRRRGSLLAMICPRLPASRPLSGHHRAPRPQSPRVPDSRPPAVHCAATSGMYPRRRGCTSPALLRADCGGPWSRPRTGC